MIKEQDAVKIISLFRSKGIRILLDGGWGVDALVGFESRNDNGDLVFEGETFPKEVFSGKERIGHLEVDCITPEWQVRFHSGYKLDDNDIKDVLMFCNKFDLAVPDEISRNFSIGNMII